MTLVDPAALFLRVNQVEDQRMFSVSPYRLFSREILSLFNLLIRYDLGDLAPSFAKDALVDGVPSPAIRSLQLFDTQRTLAKSLPLGPSPREWPADAVGVYPAMARNLQRYALLYGAALLTSPLDSSLDFGAHVRVALEGSVDDVSGITAGMVKCTLPVSRMSYKAWKTTDGFNIGYDLVSDCKRWVDERAALVDDTNLTNLATLPGARAERDAAVAALPLSPCTDGDETTRTGCITRVDDARARVQRLEHQLSWVESEIAKSDQTLQFARLMNQLFEHGVE